MKKFKVFFDIEKEERWLNEQLQKGYRCTHINSLGIYTFEQTDKSYVMRLDYQQYLSNAQFEEYKNTFEDFNWHFVMGTRLRGKKYWQKEDDGHNKIFSDRESLASYYKRLMTYALGLGTVCLLFSFMIFKDSGLYMAEGLWEMEGSMFWKAFIFETPFALLRALPAFMAVVLANIYYRANRKYSMFKKTS